MKIWTVLPVALLGFPFIANASATREYFTSGATVLNNSAIMHEHDAGWIFSTSSQVASEGIPDIIRAGDPITVNGKVVVANYIKATEILEDLTYQGDIIARAGDVTCVVASLKEDFPNAEDRDRLWIMIGDCRPE